MKKTEQKILLGLVIHIIVSILVAGQAVITFKEEMSVRQQYNRARGSIGQASIVRVQNSKMLNFL